MGNPTKQEAYKVWEDMKQRCYNEKTKQFKDYGGRGIKMCDEWRDSFAAFYRDMGDPPPGLTIERKDNNGNYNKENCTWATRQEQADNRRSQSKEHWLTLDNECHTVQDWATITGLLPATIYYRLRAGWPIKDVLSTNTKFYHK